MSKGWEIHEWTTVEKEAFLAEIAAVKARHRANGCEAFDLALSKCTCPERRRLVSPAACPEVQ